MVLCVARLGVIMQWSNQGYDSGHGWRSGICSKQTGQLWKHGGDHDDLAVALGLEDVGSCTGEKS